jgi:hypothetical protein
MSHASAGPETSACAVSPAQPRGSWPNPSISNRNIPILETHLTPAEPLRDPLLIATKLHFTNSGFSRSERGFSPYCTGPSGENTAEVCQSQLRRDLFCFEAIQAWRERVVASFPLGCLEVSVSTSEQISDGVSFKILDSGQSWTTGRRTSNGSVPIRVNIAGCFPRRYWQLLSEIGAVVRIDGGMT